MLQNGPSTSSGNKPQPEGLRKRANRLFNYQQSHKVELPIPPTPTQSKAKRVNTSNLARKTKSANIVDANRKLSSYGFTKKSKTDQGQNEGSQMVIDSQDACLKDQTEQLNAEIAENLMSISKMRENLNNEIKCILDLSGNKENVNDAISKLCTMIQSNNDKLCSLHETTQQNLLKLLALQKDLEISNIRRDNIIKANSDKIQSIETKSACTIDLQKVWITFTSDKELEELQKNGNLISNTKNIFRRMDIDVNSYGIFPIRSAMFQHIKVGNSIVPTLCVSFANEKIASIVRRKIMAYNAMLEDEGRLNEMRYSERIFWSKDVWKILKLCWELRRLKLVEYVNVYAEGIRVQYLIKCDDQKSTKLASMNVTTFSDVDKLRAIVGDIFPEAHCCDLYDDEYFKLNFAKRDKKRCGDEESADEDDGMQGNMDC